jgi:glycosyltransferase involved in cell wall biosynthesis
MIRTRIAIIYRESKEWAAGAMYLENIIHSLNTLDDSKKPIIYIHSCNKEKFIRLAYSTKYPYLKYGFLCKIFIKINFILFASKLSLIFPFSYGRISFKNKKALVWIPDFQDRYLPEYFTKQELFQRDATVKKYISFETPIVFSSEDSKNDFEKFYPQNRNKKFILRFAVTHPDFSQIEIKNLKDKFKFQGNYYFCANQFWQHKNHKILFNAIKILREKNENPTLLCSGLTRDYRNPDYFPTLEKFITENDLKKNIKILGFIDRTEQLCLMKNSTAVIQPSLFEGWSTTVEDCKALGKFMFLSDLNVHFEQIKDNVCFFDKNSAEDLASKLQNTKIREIPINYNDNIKRFGESFYEIIEEMGKTRQKLL